MPTIALDYHYADIMPVNYVIAIVRFVNVCQNAMHFPKVLWIPLACNMQLQKPCLARAVPPYPGGLALYLQGAGRGDSLPKFF